jgi:hypothetical protein
VHYREQIVVREEVICDTVEYEYEVQGDNRRLVAERNMGRTVSVSVILSALIG